MFSDESEAPVSEGGAPALHHLPVWRIVLDSRQHASAQRSPVARSYAVSALQAEHSMEERRQQFKVSEFNTSLQYILHHEVLDFRRSSCFRFSDFSTLPTGWLQQPHFAKCAWSLGTKQLYSAVMMYGNPCVVLFARSQIRIASPSKFHPNRGNLFHAWWCD